AAVAHAAAGHDASRQTGLAGQPGLLGTRFREMSPNTVEYWRLPPSALTEADVLRAFEQAEFSRDGNLQMYLHVPFCPQACRFCAFSGANSITFKERQRYVAVLGAHMKSLVSRSKAFGQNVRSIFIGGGSPDLLGKQIEHLLRSVTALQGVTERTEIGCECALLTVDKEFIDTLADNKATRLSFGIQSFDPIVRRTQRLHGLEKLHQVLRWAYGRIPVINADLITGLPGQTLITTLADLQQLMAETRINAITTYDFSPANAPSVVAGLQDSSLPPRAEWYEQVLMRLFSYETLLRHGWVRRGTNTYAHPDRMRPEDFDRISGNESIATDRYESFLIAAGPSAKSHMPGLRMEECNNLATWFAKIERGDLPVHLPNCACVHQRDLALWLFPLRHEGLPYEVFNKMLETDALSTEQCMTFAEYLNEGLILRQQGAYRLSILGEVFMGHLVRDLKSHDGKIGFDQMDADSKRLSLAILSGQFRDRNEVNDRQITGGGWALD